ncbi:cytochrome c [Alcaligenaceae bacterium]|nr:cytochrome c [Alcaligenaceae bacterium]
MDNKLLAIAGGSTLLYMVLSTLMAILPGIELSAVPPGPNVHDLTLLQQRGRQVYVSEGCAYCHTQQVRPLAVDQVFGRPSAPGDFAFSTPELLGSERTGPDLTNIGKRQSSEIWQYMHLYNPRSVVPQSVMPSFPWLFKVVDEAPKDIQAVPIPKKYAPPRGAVIPSRDAQALVAYLLSLKQPELPNNKPLAASATKPAQAAAHAPAPGNTTLTFDAANGLKLFATNCASCHGAQGAGVPGVFPPLAGNPVVNAPDPTEHIIVVLQGLHGKSIAGTSYAAQMPSFAAQLSDAEIADIIGHERSSWGNHAPTPTAKDVAQIRAQK